MRLQHRLLWTSLGLLLLGMLLHLGMLAVYEQVTYRTRITQELRLRAEILGLNSSAAISFRDVVAAQENLESLRASPNVVVACLYDADDRPLARYSPVARNCPPLGEPSTQRDTLRFAQSVRVQSQQVGSILIEERLPSLWARLPRYSLQLLSALSVETLLILILVYALRTRVLKPVDALAELAQRVAAEGDYQRRVAVAGTDEISALGRAFNRMLDVIKEREAAIQEGAQLTQALIDHAPGVITVKSLSGRYMLVNQRFARLLGKEVRDVLGETDEALFDAETAEARRDQDRLLLRERDVQRFEEKIGDRIWLSERFMLPNVRGEAFFLCTISTDISEQRATQATLARAYSELARLNESLEARVAERSAELKKAMNQLMQSEKLAALGSLVAGIAHELNTPIGLVVTASSSIGDSAHQLLRMVEENRVSRSALQHFLEDIEHGMALIERNSLRAGQLVSDFKQVAVDQTSMRHREFVLDELIIDTLHTLGPLFKHNAHRLETDLQAEVQCASYPGALEQILTNLIQNALLHGFVNQAEGLIRIVAREQGGVIRLDVSDNGCGIPPQNLSHLFDPFFTTRLGEGGSGLGLYIVHNLATGLLGGQIEAENGLDGGACFHLSFPCVIVVPPE